MVKPGSGFPPSQSTEVGFLLSSLAQQLDHDLNNGFAVMTGNLRLLRASARASRWEEIPEPLSDVERACDETAVLSRAVLGLMRAVREQNPGIHDLHQSVSKAVAVIRRGLAGEVEVEATAQERPCPVRADPSVLEAMIVALAMNARRGLRRGDTIRVSVSAIPRPSLAEHPPPGPDHGLARIFIAGRCGEAPAAAPGQGEARSRWTDKPLVALARHLCLGWRGELLIDGDSEGGVGAAVLLAIAE